MDTALDFLSRQICKPAFDLIDPRRGRRGEVDMVAWMSRQPGFDLRRLMGGVVVHDDMNVKLFGNAAVDLFQKVEEFFCPVALVTFANHEPRSDVKRSK